MPDRPEIVCICGSTRYVDEMRAANRDLTFAGVIVVAPGEAYELITNEQKTALDALHLRKIDLADRVLVVNPAGISASPRAGRSHMPTPPASRSGSLNRRGDSDKGYPSRANRAWLRERGIATTIPERDDQVARRRKRPGLSIDFGDEQRQRYRGRNVVERCFNTLKQWGGLVSGAITRTVCP